MTHHNIPVYLNYEGAPLPSWVLAETLTITNNQTLQPLRMTDGTEQRPSGPATKKITINGNLNMDLLANYIAATGETSKWSVDVGDTEIEECYLRSASISAVPNSAPKLTINLDSYEVPNAVTQPTIKIPDEGGTPITAASEIVREGGYLTLTGYFINNPHEFSYSYSEERFDNRTMLGGGAGTRILVGAEQTLDFISTGLSTGEFAAYQGHITGEITISTINGTPSIVFSSGAKISSQSYELGDVRYIQTTVREILL